MSAARLCPVVFQPPGQRRGGREDAVRRRRRSQLAQDAVGWAGSAAPTLPPRCDGGLHECAA
eukprot:1819606-Lingulodinium_polyedra.AAC.1